MDSKRGLTVNRQPIWEHLKHGPLKVAIIGSGNWGSTIARIVGTNCKRNFMFDKDVPMWVYDELIDGEKLSDIINTRHENVKYLPGASIPDNVRAVPDVRQAVHGAHLLIFCVPHQFMKGICIQLQGHILPFAKAISLVKGFDCQHAKINLMTDYVRKSLRIECCVLSGANVASDIAKEQFAEATIGYDDSESAHVWQRLFDTPYFRVNAVADVAGVEICGALKNIIALAAGFVDGLGLGSNTKAAILRIGFAEMRKFSEMFYEGVIEETFWDSCGIADLITTCYGGRNRLCAEQFVRTGKSWLELERTLLNGQKLQGTLTARDIFVFLTAQGQLEAFPLFITVYEIADTGAPADRIVTAFMSDTPRPITTRRTPISIASKL